MADKSFRSSLFKRIIDLGKVNIADVDDLVRIWRVGSGDEKAISIADFVATVDIDLGSGGSTITEIIEALELNKVPYTGATGDVDLGEYGLSAGYFKFDVSPTDTPTDQGTMFWDEDDLTVDIILNGYRMKIGEDVFYPVKNQTGSNIAKGVAVRFAGTVGSSGRLLIAPFTANGTYPSSYFMGVTAEAIANGADGKVLWFGRIRGINTNSFNEGDILYASTTNAGGYQTTVPVAPNNIIEVAAVINKSSNQGVIFVRPTLGSNINRDEGVKIVGAATGDILVRQASGLFENRTKAQFLGGSSSQFVKGDGTLDSTTYEPSFSKGALVQGGGITLSGTLTSRLVGSGNVTVDHADTSSQASVSNSNGTILQSATLDTYGHVTALTSLDGDSRWARTIEVLNGQSAWSHVSLQNGIDFTPYTTGSSGYPSTLGFAVAFYASTSDSTSGFGRAFALNREYNTENYYLGSPNTSGVHNGWRLIYHAGNLTLSTLGGVPTTRTITINGTALDLSANRSWTVGTIGGSIANEQVAYGTGSNTIGGTSTFLYKSNSLLIGTTTSASRLTVVNNTSFQGALGSDDTHQILIGAGSSYAELQGIRQLIAFDKNIVLQRQGGNVLVATTTDTGDKVRIAGNTFTDSIVTYRPSSTTVKSDNWKLGRAELATSVTAEDTWIKVQIAGKIYDILAIDRGNA